jgi:hypothetical protein
VEVRHCVEELDPVAAGPAVDQGLLQCLWDQAVLVHGDVADAGLRGLEDAEGADVGRPLGEDHVARVAEDAGDQVQALLRADSDHDLAG